MKPDRREILAIFLGGLAGAILRALITDAWGQDPGAWPWPTFLANIVGPALLGYFVTRFQERLPVLTWQRPLLTTGLCGALTTFSTMQLETLWMLERGRYGLAFAYAATSVIAGLAGVAAATNLTRRARLR